MPVALWLLLALSVLLALILAWKILRQAPADPGGTVDAERLDARLSQTESTLNQLHRGQEALSQRLTDTSARTSLLRDEVLGVTQRTALFEDSVRELAKTRHDGELALRVDEAELLLTVALQRLQLAGDLPGAVRATELADSVLAQQHDPVVLNLRQALAQELVALRAAPLLPKTIATRELDAFEANLPALAGAGPEAPSAAPPEDSGLHRLLGAVVQVRPSGAQDLLAPEDRSVGQAALGLELALARTALEHQDQPAFRASLRRVERWLLRLYPVGPVLTRERSRLGALGKLELAASLPEAGSTLEELRAWQKRRAGTP